jgi:hypothetical protein
MKEKTPGQVMISSLLGMWELLESELPRTPFHTTWFRSLEFVPKKFDKHITNECGYYSDLKIGHRKNIINCPNQALAPVLYLNAQVPPSEDWSKKGIL